MNRLIVIVGLPGSGKTHYGEELAKKEGLLFLDEIGSTKELEKQIGTTSCVITDPSACMSEIRNCIKALFPQVEFVYFENDSEQCLKNARNRKNKPVDAMIKYLTKEYVIPADAAVLPVWKNS